MNHVLTKQRKLYFHVITFHLKPPLKETVQLRWCSLWIVISSEILHSIFSGLLPLHFLFVSVSVCLCITPFLRSTCKGSYHQWRKTKLGL